MKRSSRLILLLVLALFVIEFYVFQRRKPIPRFRLRSKEFSESIQDGYKRLFVSSTPIPHIDKVGQQIRHWKELRKSKLEVEEYQVMLDVTDKALFSWISPMYKRTEDLKMSFEGDGIVICVNDKYASMALATLRSIREVLHSTLPFEVFYMGDEDLSSINRDLFKLIPDTKVIDIDKVFALAEIKVWGWAVKSFALLASSFRNAMLIDADITFFYKPEEFFRGPLFQDHRALFFQDRTIKVTDQQYYYDAREFIDSLVPMNESIRMKSNRLYHGLSSHQQESGVVLIDKVDRFEGLLAVCLLNSGKTRTEAYKHMYGDKETFWIGFEMVNQDYAFNPKAPGAVGVADPKSKNEVCSIQLIHVDALSRPAWINGGLLKNKFFDDTTLVELNEFLIEPGTWRFISGNAGCLRGHQKPTLLTDMERDTMAKSLVIFSQEKEKIIPHKLPVQISPWSYRTKACDDSTDLSQFKTWVADKEEIWKTTNDYSIEGYRRELNQHIKNYVDPIITSRGRGIIYSCHPRLVDITIISIKFLRHFGCTLDVEVWHLDELRSEDIAKLEKFENVKVMNLADVRTIHVERDVDGKIYQLKTAALFHSHFDEILFLDSDNVAARDPTFLFDSPAYRETGAIFWKDFWYLYSSHSRKTRQDNPIWRILGLQCVDEFEQESGQMVINKSAPGVLKALSVAYFMQERSSFYFKLIAGDKDTFRLSWRLFNLPFHMVRPHISALGPALTRKVFCGHSMVQYAPYWGESEFGSPPLGYSDPTEPEVLFVHSNGLKYSPYLFDSVVIHESNNRLLRYCSITIVQSLWMQ